MNKNILIIFCIIFIVLIACVTFFIYNQRPKDLSKVSDSQIIYLLQKNPDAKEYIKNHSDFKIIKKEVLTAESIEVGKNGPNFTEVYQGLDLENNRYMRVDLMNSTGDRGQIAVIDFKTRKTVKAYGILLLKTTANKNEQTGSQTTNTQTP